MRDASAAGGVSAGIDTVPVDLWRFYAYFLRIGTTGFEGPIALAGFMRRALVERSHH